MAASGQISGYLGKTVLKRSVYDALYYEKNGRCTLPKTEFEHLP
jgi:hypothetical protein